MTIIQKKLLSKISAIAIIIITKHKKVKQNERKVKKFQTLIIASVLEKIRNLREMERIV